MITRYPVSIIFLWMSLVSYRALTKLMVYIMEETRMSKRSELISKINLFNKQNGYHPKIVSMSIETQRLIDIEENMVQSINTSIHECNFMDEHRPIYMLGLQCYIGDDFEEFAMI